MARNLARDENSAGTEFEHEQYTNETETGCNESEQTSKSLLNRRNYLRLGAAAAVAVVGTGATNSVSAATDDHGMTFDRVVNAVGDLGWDPSGNEPVTASLRENMQDGTLIELPPGTYLVDDTVSKSNLTNWGIRGTGGDKGDARFVVPQGKALRVLQVGRGSRNVLVENLTFDMYDTWDTCIGNAFLMEDNLVFKDVEYAGKTPSEYTGATALLPVYVFDPNGTAVIDGVEMTGASELVDYPKNPLAIFSGKETEGTIYIRNSRFENRGEHAIYASRCVGNVCIDNCYFKNNQNTHARISGDGSWVKNSVFVWDNDNHPNKGEFQAQTGMTFEGGFQGFTGGLAENCTFICASSAPNSGCLKIDGSNGGADIRGCEFQVDAHGAPPIVIEAPGDSHMIDGTPEKPWDVDVENVHIHGSGTSRWNITGALEMDGRDGSVLRDVCIHMDGDRDGICLANMTGDVTDCNVVAPGQAIALENAYANTTNLTHTSCTHAITEYDPTTEHSSSSEDSGSDSGSSDDGSTTTTYSNKVTLIADRGADAFDYEFKVDGEAALYTDGAYKSNPGGELGEHLVENDDGTVSVTGMVAGGGGDTFSYDGEIVDYVINGPATIQHNGEVVDPELLITRDTVRVLAKEGASQFAYEFTVGGAAALIASGDDPAEDGEEKVTQNDDGTVTVNGTLTGGEGDSFRTEGEILSFRTDGNPVVYRNGSRIDWEALGLSRVVSIKGDGSLASYAVTVTGKIAPNPETGGLNSEDSISGGTAEGAVSGGTDSYLFSGSIADLRLTGSSTVLVDGTEVDPADLGLDHQLEVVGTGSKSTYGVTVDGELAASPDGDVSDEDVIDGATASGAVTAETDKFLFSGDVTAFEVQGDAAVYLDGQQVDPSLLTAGTDPVLANVFVVQGRGKGSTSDYSVDVSGTVEKAPDLAASEADDVITANGDVKTVTGTVADDDDGYRFSGSITSMSIHGSASISFAELDG